MTDNPYFRLITTLIGIAVTESWKLENYHKILTLYRETELPITFHSGMLSKQLLQYENKIDMMKKMRINVTDGMNHHNAISEMSTSASTNYSAIAQATKRFFFALGAIRTRKNML